MTYKNLRLRVFDLNTLWFWFTIFYEPFAYGDSWLKIEVWNPHSWRKFWIHFWKWEEIPNSCGMEGEPLSEREQKL